MKLVFFSGGSALGQLASHLAAIGSAPVYIITTFDSGGSTQALRKVIAMPAVGDLRNRLLSSAEPGQQSRKLIQFLKARIGTDQDCKTAHQELLARIAHSGLEELDEWRMIKSDLEAFLANVPAVFDARRASMGNLALTGNWFTNGRSLRTALSRYRKLLHVKADLIPVCEQDLHLGFRLANGQTLIGQHLLHNALPAPISHIFLTQASPWLSEACHTETRPAAATEAIAAITSADVLCFSMGSFFSSLLATLLPAGIGRAIATSGAIKVYVPNTGPDIELSRLDLVNQIETLLAVLKTDAPEARPQNLLNDVLLDSVNGQYHLPDLCTFTDYLQSKGIGLYDRRIIASDGKHEPASLLAALEETISCSPG